MARFSSVLSVRRLFHFSCSKYVSSPLSLSVHGSVIDSDFELLYPGSHYCGQDLKQLCKNPRWSRFLRWGGLQCFSCILIWTGAWISPWCRQGHWISDFFHISSVPRQESRWASLVCTNEEHLSIKAWENLEPLTCKNWRVPLCVSCGRLSSEKLLFCGRSSWTSGELFCKWWMMSRRVVCCNECSGVAAAL